MMESNYSNRIIYESKLINKVLHNQETVLVKFTLKEGIFKSIPNLDYDINLESFSLEDQINLLPVYIIEGRRNTINDITDTIIEVMDELSTNVNNKGLEYTEGLDVIITSISEALKSLAARYFLIVEEKNYRNIR